MKQGILGSGSPARAEIMHSLGLKFDIIPSDFPEESLSPSLNIHEHPLTLAQAKMEFLLQNKDLRADYLVTADTLVFQGERILGKPDNKIQAKEWLLSYAGQELIVTTGLVLVSGGEKERRSGELVKSILQFGNYTEEVVDFYLSLSPPLEVAGAFAWQSGAEVLIGQLNGSASAVIGLPIFEFYAMLRKHDLV